MLTPLGADNNFVATESDSFTLYPAMNGTAYESIRGVIMQQVLQDIRVMHLCESLYSHEKVVAAIEAVVGREVHFDTCALSVDMSEAIRERINEMIAAKL